MIRFAAVAAALMLAAPSAAQTFDAFSSFNGSQGAGNFGYGTTDYTTGPTFFSVNTGCIPGTTCLAAASGATPPFVFKSTAAGSFGTVIIPDDRLVVHPGPTATDGGVFVAFFSPIASEFEVRAAFSVQDTSPSGVAVNFLYEPVFGVPNFTFVGKLDAQTTSGSYATRVFLPAGGILAVIFDKDGDYSNDSTGVNLTLTAVPEPATWGLMIAGFGMVGAALRRRTAVAAGA